MSLPLSGNCFPTLSAWKFPLTCSQMPIVAMQSHPYVAVQAAQSCCFSFVHRRNRDCKDGQFHILLGKGRCGWENLKKEHFKLRMPPRHL